MNPLNELKLGTLRMPAKLLLTAVLFTLGTGYLFALSNVALKIGFLPDDVALHYFGNEASRQALEAIEDDAAAAVDSEGGIVEDDAVSFDDLDQDAGISDEPFVPIRTLETLISEGHFHLFGYTSIFFLCGLGIRHLEHAAYPIRRAQLLLDVDHFRNRDGGVILFCFCHRYVPTVVPETISNRLNP